jgi:hypothetical protein
LRGRKRAASVGIAISAKLSGRKITWGDKISHSKKGRSYQFTEAQKRGLDAGRKRVHSDKEREFMGRNNLKRKLSDDAVQEIRRLGSDGGLSQREIGERFGVRQVAIGRILRGRTFRWLPVTIMLPNQD